MSVSEMIKALNHLPNFLYVFYSDDGCNRVILGGQSSPTKDKYDSLDGAEYHFNILEELYEKENLTDDEKASMGYRMKRVMNACDYRHSKLYTLKQQEEYLNDLSAESLDEISNQIQMYIKAREYYRDYVYKKR